MSLSIPSQITVPFADAGLRTAIPAISDNTTGRAGYDQGFPPINMTPKTAGGIPPFGQDMNGIMFAVTEALRFMESGVGFVYSAPFSTAIGGYNAGARVLRTDGRGYWLNTANNNTVDPESAGGAAAGWVPDYTNGTAPVTMTNANVTLTPLQYGRPIIVITGTLTTNVSLIFPAISGQWIVLNNTTGSFTITCRTAAGSGVPAPASLSIVGDGTNIYSAGTIPDASTTVAGKVELATNAEAQAATDATRAVTPANLGASMLGYGQAWQTVARTSGTTYTNNTGKPIQFVAIGSNSAATTLTMVIGAYTFPNAVQSTGAVLSILASYIIPIGSTYGYTVSAGTVTIMELR